MYLYIYRYINRNIYIDIDRWGYGWVDRTERWMTDRGIDRRMNGYRDGQLGR